MTQKMAGGISKVYQNTHYKQTAVSVATYKQYEANPELAILAYSIRIGVKINPYVPPEHITYDMLLDDIGTEDAIRGRKGRQRRPVISIEEQKGLRMKLWKIWYKIIKGYSSYGKISRKPISQFKLHSTTSSSEANKAKSGGGQKTDIELLTELNATRAGILNILSKSRKREKEYKAELAYFKSAEKDANKYVKNALQIKYEVDDMTPEDIQALAKHSTIKYPYPEGYTSLYQPINALYMFGMQLPHQFNRKQLLETMLYLLFKKKIYNYVDLHDCYKTSKDLENVVEGIGCNPYDRQAQLEMWGKAVSAIYPEKPNTLYYGIEGYEDMFAGSAGAWESISKLKDVKDPSNSVVIHCLAGAGRTGSVVFYLLLRDYFASAETIERLQQSYYGYRNISEFIEAYKSLFGTALDIEHMKKEFFDAIKVASATRLRQRLNRIFFHLAKEFKVNTFYTFGTPTKVVEYLPDDEFANPIKHTVDWDDVAKETVVDWFK